MCFFVGGTQFSEQGFGQSKGCRGWDGMFFECSILFLKTLGSSQLNSSLLTVSVIALLLPAAFHFTASSSISNEGKDILSLSHGVCCFVFRPGLLLTPSSKGCHHFVI
jgi:Ca2+:H+ antiporter